MPAQISRGLIGLAALSLATAPSALAQDVETCIIDPTVPSFETAGAQDGLHALPHPSSAPHTAFHGQGVYGEDTLYLSHLAVFMALPQAHPHNFQVILEVEPEDPATKAAYQADRIQHPDPLYTMVPPRFEQTALVTAHAGRTPLVQFPASTMFRGHFEQGGQPILDELTFRVRRVIHFREFLFDGAKLPDQHYLLFGRDQDVFLAHLLSAPPDFDQILSVAFTMEDEVASDTMRALVEDLLAQGLYLHLPDRDNEIPTRLIAGDALTCTLQTDTGAPPLQVAVRVMSETYCEAGEFTTPVTNEFNQPRRCDG
jgi:hypothetical protein